jgi:hypothetical protein|tara:strand:- start:320 stop:802 length:483 start_codon:yes stop_codon:yes gene_type:complete
MSNLSDKIEKIFDYYSSKKKRLYLPKDHNDFVEFLKIRRHFKITQSKIIEKKSELFELINRVQDSYLDLIEDYEKVLIAGGAGTGKTFCAVKRAKRYLNEGFKVLFLCFNKNLAGFLKLYYFSAEKQIDCYNFHLFINNIIGSEMYNKLFDADNGRLEGL